MQTKSILNMASNALIAIALLFGAMSSHADQRIVNGSEAAQGAWPFMVSLLSKGAGSNSDRHTCGGTLVANDLVLTAAHCVPHPTKGVTWVKSLVALLGTDTLNSNEGIEVPVVEIMVHPKYTESAYGSVNYDFALLRLERPVNLPVIRLAQPKEVARTGNAFIAGWGVTDQKKVKSQNELREGIVELVSDESCKEIYGGNFDEASMLCAGSTKDVIVDTCYGDSGGPLLVQDGAQWVQVGVTSWGQGCAAPGYPGVYAEVAQVSDWIAENQDFGARLPELLDAITTLSRRVYKSLKSDKSQGGYWSKSRYAKLALKEKLGALKAYKDYHGSEIQALHPELDSKKLSEVSKLAKKVSRTKGSKKQKSAAFKSLNEIVEKTKSLL